MMYSLLQPAKAKVHRAAMSQIFMNFSLLLEVSALFPLLKKVAAGHSPARASEKKRFFA
jgi:hypothetical protein